MKSRFIVIALVLLIGVAAISQSIVSANRLPWPGVRQPHAGEDAASGVSGGLALAEPREAVAVWNRRAAQLATLPPPAAAIAPVRQNRILAIVQVAVHDAVNGITGKYATYLSPGPAPSGASPEAAAIAAAHRALTSLFPTQTGSLDSLFQMTLADHGLSDTDPGIGYGRSAADAILALRANDGAGAPAACAYNPPDAGTPGVYVPLAGQTALLPCFGSVDTWVMRSGSQFRPEGPPALTSEQYARDYNEIKEIGVLNSTTRTQLQTQIASFWLASPVAIWNQVVDQTAASRDLDISATARLYALVYIAATDASIACWDAKYVYRLWRPQPAIRNGDLDGNDLTIGDPTWTPLHPTPAHPDYTSGHATVSSSIATIMTLVFGDEPGIPLVATVGTPIGPITRQWGSFSEGVDEVIDARVYSGIHFRTADVVGARTGRQAARFAFTHALQPCGRGKSKCG